MQQERIHVPVFLFVFFLCFCFWPQPAACGFKPGIEPTTLAMKAQSLDHWTVGEFPHVPVLRTKTRSSGKQGCQDQLKC